jgi:hypothetical protein
MSQQINLFNPLFRKQGFSFTSATAMLYGAGIAVALMAAVAAYANYELRAAQAAAQAVDAEYQAVVARRDALAAAVAALKPNPELEKEVLALEATLFSRREVVDTLKSGAIGNTQGFSAYMLAFSRQSLSGLWLTGFDVAGNELAIQGRTLNADLVSKYLVRLNQEKALNGRQFGAMRINRQAAAPVTAAEPAKKGEAAAKEPAAPAANSELYTEFSISTIALPESAKAVAKNEPLPVPLLGQVPSGAVLDAPKAPAAGARK